MYGTSRRNRTSTVSVSLAILVAVTTMQLSIIMVSNGNVIPDNVYAKYSTNSQAQSLVNDCDVFDSGGAPNCQNNAPQTMADGTAPISIQKSNPGQEAPRQQLQVRTVIGDLVGIEPRETGRVTASCAPDEFATGGGLNVGDGQNVINPTFSGGGVPLDAPNAWEVFYTNHGPSEILISAIAECAKLVDAP